MADESYELKTLWKEQKTEVIEMKALTQLDNNFRETIRQRNWLEWIACVVVAVFFSVPVLADGALLIRIGAAIVVTAALFVAYKLWRDGRVETQLDPTLPTSDNVARHRENLLRQARLLRRAPLWYVAPIALGWSFIWVGGFLVRLSADNVRAGDFLYLALCVTLFVGVAWLNLRAAQKLDRKAADLA